MREIDWCYDNEDFTGVQNRQMNLTVRLRTKNRDTVKCLLKVCWKFVELYSEKDIKIRDFMLYSSMTWLTCEAFIEAFSIFETFFFQCLWFERVRVYQDFIHSCLNQRFVFQVRTSHEICKKAKIPSLGFSETAEEVFRHGPPALRPWSKFAR